MVWGLKKLRDVFKEKQSDTAKVIGRSENAYMMKENGSRDFTSTEMKLLAEHYELTPKEVCEIFLGFDCTQTKFLKPKAE